MCITPFLSQHGGQSSIYSKSSNWESNFYLLEKITCVRVCVSVCLPNFELNKNSILILWIFGDFIKMFRFIDAKTFQFKLNAAHLSWLKK